MAIEHSECVSVLEDADTSVHLARIGSLVVGAIAPPLGEQPALPLTR
jgi:hypothetical protein